MNKMKSEPTTEHQEIQQKNQLETEWRAIDSMWKMSEIQLQTTAFYGKNISGTGE